MLLPNLCSSKYAACSRLVFPSCQFFQVYSSWRKTFITFSFLLFKHESSFPWPYLTSDLYGSWIPCYSVTSPRISSSVLLFWQVIICLHVHAVCCPQSPGTCLPDRSFSVLAFSSSDVWAFQAIFPPYFVHGYLLTDFIIGCYNANIQTLGLRRVFLFNSKRGTFWGFTSVPQLRLQGAQIWTLVRELRSHILHSQKRSFGVIIGFGKESTVLFSEALLPYLFFLKGCPPVQLINRILSVICYRYFLLPTTSLCKWAPSINKL